jgi:hypothetical protein
MALNPQDDDVYTVAFVLMDFLATLSTPILPIYLLDETIEEYEARGDRDDRVVQGLFRRLPRDNCLAFLYIVSFFREMLSCADKNKLNPEKISEILCECLIGEDWDAKSAPSNYGAR